MWLRTQGITFAANYMKYEINKTSQNTAVQKKSGQMRTTFYELFNTKTIKFCPKLLDGKSQIGTTLLKINRTCNCFGRGTKDSIILVNQQTIILMTGCPVHIISMKKSFPFSIVVNCQSLLFICQPSFRGTQRDYAMEVSPHLVKTKPPTWF